MSFTSLAFYLIKKKVSLIDRIAVSQTILHDPTFHIGNFLLQVIGLTFLIETLGAILLYLFNSCNFSLFSAIFHSVSAFCNAGFSLNSSNLIPYRGNLSVNLIIAALIITGGLGFSVLIELKLFLLSYLKGNKQKRINWQSLDIIKTSLFLVILGWVYIFLAEFVFYHQNIPLKDAILASLFQSITCRTAGFNTLNVDTMTNASLVFMIFLMFVGGAPGSCAGGIKITTFRVLTSFIISQIKGKSQVVIGKFAVDKDTINKSFTLLFFSILIVFISTVVLDFTEGADASHIVVRGKFLEILFEVVSAFGTVGLSTGITPKLSFVGKIIIINLMFIGRLGPLVLLALLHTIREKILYYRPEEKLAIG